jgi:TetR/AcrR family transcriptional regulator, transcriptional repressor for nem operon
VPRVSREQTGRNRELIEAASARLFREHGFNGVSVADIMASAGLTHGGFYGHFDSKDELASVACGRAFDAALARWQSLIEENPAEADFATALAAHYFSRRQCDEPGSACPVISLATDVARQRDDRPVRGIYARGVKAMLAMLLSFSHARRTKKARRAALAKLSLLVGAVTLARALHDDPLSDEILDAARDHLRAGCEER